MKAGTTFALFALAIIGVVAVAAGASLLGAWVASLLWNWLAPMFFDAPLLSVWQAWGVLFLLMLVGNTLFRRGSSA